MVEVRLGVERSNSKGLTLAEIMIALAVLAITLLALVALQASILKGRQKSTAQLHASKIAGAIMVDLENRLGSDITLDVTQPRTEVPEEIRLDSPYEFEYEVEQSFDGPPSEGLKDVAVTIYWKDKNGEQKRTVWSKFVER